MAVTYCTHYDISAKLKHPWAKAIFINASTGVSQANKDRIYVADTSPFTIGDLIRIVDSTEKTGEDLVVDSIVTDTHIVTTTNMTKDYTQANKGNVGSKSVFNNRTSPTRAEVEDLINQAEDYIDDETRHGWRVKTATDEYHNLNAYHWTFTGLGVKLLHRMVKAMDTLEGDKIEVWLGSSWIDYVTTRSEGRANDFWLDYTNGISYLRTWYIRYHQSSLRITYRYGESSVTNTIKRACILLATADVLDMEPFVAKQPSGDLDNIDARSKQDRYRDEANKIIARNREHTSL